MENSPFEVKKEKNLVFLNPDSDEILRVCSDLEIEAKNENIGDLVLIYFNKKLNNTCECNSEKDQGAESVATVYWSVKNIYKMIGMLERIKLDILNQTEYEEYMEGSGEE